MSGAPKKRKSKLAGRLAMFEQASQQGIDSVSKKPAKSPKKGRKKGKSKMAGKLAMFEDKGGAGAETTTTNGAKPPTNTGTRKSVDVGANETDKTDNKNDKNGETSNDNNDKKESEKTSTTKAKPKKINNKLAGKAGLINLAGLKGGPPPSLAKKRKEAASKPKELTGEEFPRVVMKVDRNKRSRPPTDIEELTADTEIDGKENKDRIVELNENSKSDNKPDTNENNENENENNENKHENDNLDTIPESNNKNENENENEKDKKSDEEIPNAKDVDAENENDNDNDKTDENEKKDDDTTVTTNKNENNENDDNNDKKEASDEPKTPELIDTTKAKNETLTNNLNVHMKENFKYDKEMLIPSKFLFQYLKEECNIDLSTPGTAITDNGSNGSLVWDIDGLNDSVSNLFGNNSVSPFGYSIRLIKDQQRKKKFETV